MNIELNFKLSIQINFFYSKMSEVGSCESPLRRAFENKEDFMKYYNEHKEEIDKLTTKQLNSVYKIESCKITRNKNKIVIRNISSKDKDVKED